MLKPNEPMQHTHQPSSHAAPPIRTPLCSKIAEPSLLQQLTLFYTMVAHIPQPTLQLGQGLHLVQALGPDNQTDRRGGRVGQMNWLPLNPTLAHWQPVELEQCMQ